MTPADKALKIEAALSEWIEGEIVARKSDQFGTTVVITKSGEGFTVLRAFALGEDAGVSVDLRDSSAEQVFNHLLKAFG